MLTGAREEQPLKAYCPMEVTEEGIITEAREEQPWKAAFPMEVTEEGRFTAVTLQPWK